MQGMAESRKGRVLLVDDDAAVLKLYARVLRASKFDVIEASDSVAAVALAQEQAFDVVVSDIAMPRLSGLGLLEAVRQTDLDVPVILLTGLPKLDSAIRAVEHGAFRYLAKPIDVDTFVGVVSQAAKMHQLALTKRRALDVLNLEQMKLGDRAGLEARFNSALASLWMAYQPIVSCCEKRVYAYEALVRSTEAALPHPGALFDAATRLNRLYDLGHAIRCSIAATMPALPDGMSMFVNLHVLDLLDERLFADDAALDPWASRIVLEVTERSSLDEVSDVQGRVARLRKKGYRIAVDDLGAGYAGLSTFTQLEPEVVKLDMLLIRDIDKTTTKQKIVQSMAVLCAEMGARVVAEGIETEAEAKTVLSLGCDLLQGYHFAKPGKAFPSCAGFIG
jgi:EAL domain-containing protein (putative c-di-GMP-specific phosphodiesterase class I)/CheY-like chemotaxis protein